MDINNPIYKNVLSGEISSVKNTGIEFSLKKSPELKAKFARLRSVKTLLVKKFYKPV